MLLADWPDEVTQVAKAYEGDYEFGAANHFDDDYRRLPILTPDYAEIGRTFAASLDRVRALGWLPIELVFWAGLFEASKCAARHRLGLDPLDNSRDADPAVSSKWNEVWAEVSPDRHSNPHEYVWGAGVPSLTLLLKKEIEDKRAKYRTAGIEAILAAMITASYAAFETMAADPWVVAVNRHFALFKRYVAKKPDRQIPGPVLASYEGNISQVGGKVLLETGKVKFQTFNDIRNAYGDTFGADIDFIFLDVKDIYETEKVRHLIAHRGGLVDAKFHREMQEQACADYMNLPVGGQIPFNGPLACRHINACARLGVALFSFVDGWEPT